MIKIGKIQKVGKTYCVIELDGKTILWAFYDQGSLAKISETYSLAKAISKSKHWFNSKKPLLSMDIGAEVYIHINDGLNVDDIKLKF